jgi:segregation and condensation protein A
MSSLDAAEDLLDQSEAGELAGADVLTVDIDGFEGPLHLLLALARRNKIDLARLSILRLAEQYLAFIADAKRRRLDLAADYLLMAAWLAYLKSRLLLPAQKGEAADPDAEGMAERLAFRLVRLDAMRRAVERLQGGRIDGRDVFARGAPQRSVVAREVVWRATLYEITTAFAAVRLREVSRRAHVVARQPVLSLDVARRRLAGMAPALTDWRPVTELRPAEDDAPGAPPTSVVASFFSAALELTRDRLVELRQDAPLREVYVRGRRDGGGRR